MYNSTNKGDNVTVFPGDSNASMSQQLQKLKDSIMEMLKRCGDITRNILTAGSTAKESLSDIAKAEEAISR